jgi:pyridoxal biosynthesis lyase PdxS
VSNDISVDVLVEAVRKIENSRYLNDLSKVFVQVTGMRNVDENKHPFDERVVSRIRILKNFFPALILQVGGQMNPATARLVKDAGADRLVVGSYIFGHEDMNEALYNLRKALTEELPPAPRPEIKVEVPQSKVKEVKKTVETKAEKEKREKYEASKHEIIYDFDPNGDLGERNI